MHNVLGTEGSYIELRPAKLLLKSGEQSKPHFVGTGDKIWAQRDRETSRRIPLGMGCEYLVTDEVNNE